MDDVDCGYKAARAGVEEVRLCGDVTAREREHCIASDQRLEALEGDFLPVYPFSEGEGALVDNQGLVAIGPAPVHLRKVERDDVEHCGPARKAPA